MSFILKPGKCFKITLENFSIVDDLLTFKHSETEIETIKKLVADGITHYMCNCIIYGYYLWVSDDFPGDLEIVYPIVDNNKINMKVNKTKEKCSCSIDILMDYGCKCGGV
jgi:hypothetical protein